MRIRITQPLSGSIDGIQLSRFVVGLTYEVGTTLANYLLAQGFAVPVDDDVPALVLPIREISDAADRSRQRRKAKR